MYGADVRGGIQTDAKVTDGKSNWSLVTAQMATILVWPLAFSSCPRTLQKQNYLLIRMFPFASVICMCEHKIQTAQIVQLASA